MLLLYVDDLFLTRKEALIKDATKESFYRVLDEGLGYDALLSRHGCVEECIWNLPYTREVCNGYLGEVWDDGLQGHGHNYGIELESIE